MNFTPDEHSRFMAKIEEKNGCWLWTGPLDRDGYGTFYFRRKGRRAHRVGWYMTRGDIPSGLVVNHVCGNRHCVNAQHLELVTVRENALKDSRSVGAINARKTHCKHGHPFDRTMTVKGRIQRVCSVCEREKHRRLRRKWLAEDTLNV